VSKEVGGTGVAVGVGDGVAVGVGTGVVVGVSTGVGIGVGVSEKSTGEISSTVPPEHPEMMRQNTATMTRRWDLFILLLMFDSVD